MDTPTPKPFQRLLFERAIGKPLEAARLWVRLTTWLKPGVNHIFFWQCAQNHAVRPPILADLSFLPHRGHFPSFPRCGRSHDFGIRSASAFAVIAFSMM